MRELLATTFTGIVVDENEQFYFVQKNGITFRLKKEEGTHAIGEAVEGFGYLNQKQEPALTTTIPTVRIGSYGFGTVTGTRRDLGVFVDVAYQIKMSLFRWMNYQLCGNFGLKKKTE